MQISRRGRCVPNLVIVCPSCLVSVDTLTTYFQRCKRRPLGFFVGGVGPGTGATPVLVNGLTDRFLSSCVGRQNSRPIACDRAIGGFFTNTTLRFYAYSLPTGFRTLTRSRVVGVHSFIRSVLPRGVHSFSGRGALLRTSFVYRQLKLRKHMSVLRGSFGILVRRGSKGHSRCGHGRGRSRFVRVVLCRNVLVCGFNRRARSLRAFLLCSGCASKLLVRRFTRNLFERDVQLHGYVITGRVTFKRNTVIPMYRRLAASLLGRFRMSGGL